MPEAPLRLASKPGIKRDSTRFDNEHYIDGKWCRFQRGMPKKMGGYQQVTDTVPEITRGMHSFSSDDIQYLHLGHPDTLGQYLVSNGTLNAFNDRTPAGFVTNVNNLWQFDIFADTSGTGNHVLLAHSAQNAANIDNSVNGTLYLDTIDASAVLNTVGLHADWNGGEATSGGVVVSGVYTWTYGSRGLILQSVANNLSMQPTAINIGTQKIVKGMPLRGAGNGPAALFWGLNILIRATSTGATPAFAYDVIARGTSIMSSQGVVEMDGIYYWPGVDRFLMFNGVVREMPNDMNQNYFFDNINFTHRQKCFGFKIPRYGEIWWCYPRGSATECTHAVVFNVREGYWYDTPLPDNDDVNQGRCAGIYADVYQRPFMVDNEVTANGRTLWQHETAFDKIRLSNISAVQSFFETHEFALLDQGVADKSIRCARVEPDLVQIGDMSLTMRGRSNAKADVIDVTPTQTIFESPSSGDEETVKFKDIRRLASWKFESNIGGGNYELGKTYAHIEPADGRIES